MNAARRIVLVDADDRLTASLAPALAGAGFAVKSIHASAAALLADTDAADGVVLDAATVGGQPVDTVRALLARDRGLCVIVTGGTPAAVSHAVAGGACGFLLKPYTAGDLAAVLTEAFAARRHLAAERPRGRIVATYSPKGGAGCTTVAVALGVLTAALPNTKVALVDLDLQFGDADVMLDLRSPNSIVDLLGHERLDETVVQETFSRHASGLRLLPAPADLASAARVAPDSVERALHALRDHFDVIVVDLWSTLDDLTTRVLRAADTVVLVTKPELPSLKAMARVLAAHDLHLELEPHALLVANRLPCRGGLSSAEVEHSLGHGIDVAIPSDSAVVTDALNRGISVVDPRVRGRFGPAYRALAQAVWSNLKLSAPARPAGQPVHA